MRVCFVCGENKSEKKMHKEQVSNKNVCKACFGSMSKDPGWLPEREIQSLIRFDKRGHADPKKEGGMRLSKKKR